MSEVVQKQLNRAVHGTVFIFLGTVVSFLLGFSAKIIIVNKTTQEEFGIYSLAVAVVSIFNIVATLGIHEGITRYVSVSLGEGRGEDASSMSKASLHIVLLSGIVFFLALLLFSKSIAQHVFSMPELVTPLKIISFFVPFSVFMQVMVGILRGRGFVWPQIYQSAGQSFFFLCILAIFTTLGLSLISVIYAYLLSVVIVFVAVILVACKKLEFSSLFQARSHYRTLLKFSFPLLIVNITGVALTWADSLLLGRFTGAATVGIYNVSITLAKLLEFPVVALAFVFLPIAAEFIAKNQLVELKRTYQVLTKWIFSATLPLFFLFFFFPELTLKILFGDRFTIAAASLRILSLGFISSSFWGANGVLMIALGMTREVMSINILGAVLNIVLNYVLIKEFGYGVMGAAAASMASIFVMNVLASVFIYVKIEIHPITAKYMKPIICSSVISLLIFSVTKNFPHHSWLLPIYLFLFTGCYLFSLVATRSVDNEDRHLLAVVLIKLGLKKDL